jgi:hypothetical protein
MPKKAIYEKFKLSAADRQKFDADIRRLTIVHEISPATVNIAAGENVTAFYVVLGSLRSAECDKKNISLISKLIDQNMLFVLEHESRARLAVLRGGVVVQSDWRPLEEWTLKLTGLNLDDVWDNIIVQISGVEIAPGNTLDQQLAADVEREKLMRRIERLEKKARSERQPRRKLELVMEAKQLLKVL